MLLDSNIIIYAFQSKFQGLQVFMDDSNTCCSAISRLETLGYPRLSKPEKNYLQKCFDTITVFSVTDAVIKSAITLRQQKNMSLGDAIIAATALEHHQTLATRNLKDFDWVEGLKVVDPLADVA